MATGNGSGDPDPPEADETNANNADPDVPEAENQLVLTPPVQRAVEQQVEAQFERFGMHMAATFQDEDNVPRLEIKNIEDAKTFVKFADKQLDTHKEMHQAELTYKQNDGIGNRRAILIGMGLLFVFLIGIAYLFKDHPDKVLPVITHTLAVGVGLVAGIVGPKLKKMFAQDDD